MGDLLRLLAAHKRLWIPPILAFAALLVWFAWEAAETPANPFEYRLG